MIEFKYVEIEDRAIYKKYEEIVETPASFYNFTNIFMWRKFLKTKYAIIDGFLCTVCCFKNRCYAYFPIGEGDPTSAIQKLWDYYGDEFKLTFVTNDMAEVLNSNFNGKLNIEKNRDNFDYIYLAEKLITLKGKKLHSKRNHINAFKGLYNFEFKEINKDNLSECMKAEEEWLLQHKDETMPEAEKIAIKEAFTNFEALNLFGGALVVDGKIIAFSLGEKMTESTALIHIEKADTSYKGSYAMINNLFANHFLKDFKYINREEDMGVPGLRKAKLSYYPDILLEISVATPLK